MNITFDDTSPYLTFSDEWRVQPPNDEAAKGFWQGASLGHFSSYQRISDVVGLLCAYSCGG